MADQRIDYEQGSVDTGDSGARLDEESIKPNLDGEVLRQTVLRRPTENIRERTEIIRNELESLKYLSDTNIKWIISSSPLSSHPSIISWDPDTGEVRFSNDLCFQPLASIDADRLTSFSWDFTDTIPMSGSLNFANTLTADKGGDTLELCLSYTATTATLNVTTSGSPVNRISVEVSDDGSVTLGELRTALLALSEISDVAGPGVLWVLTFGGNLATKIESAGTPTTAGTYDTLDTANREMHILPAGTWAAWNSTLTNPIMDGDTVGIYYPFLTDPTSFFDPTSTAHGGRRQRFGTDTDVVAADLFRSSDPTLFNQPGGAVIYDGPAKLPLCIPICKRIGRDLIFFDNTFVCDPAVLTAGFQTLKFGENAYTVDRFTGSGVAVSAYVGTGASVILFSLTADILQTNLENLVDVLNNKGSLTGAETVIEKWTFDVTGVVATKSTAIEALGKGSESFTSINYPIASSLTAAVKGVGETVNVSPSLLPGTGVIGVGGDNSNTVTPATTGGVGAIFLGGNSTATGEGYGGYGLVSQGGLGGGSSGNGGAGLLSMGAEANLTHANPGAGAYINGGNVEDAASSSAGATGVRGIGGSTLGSGAGGTGVRGEGGTSGSGENGVGVWGYSNHGYGVKAQGYHTNPKKAGLQIIQQLGRPSPFGSSDSGAVWFDSSNYRIPMYYNSAVVNRVNTSRAAVTGQCQSSLGATYFTDTTKYWYTNRLVGMRCYNTTDGSSGVVTANTTTTVTVDALTGGSDNSFQVGDTYVLYEIVKVSPLGGNDNPTNVWMPYTSFFASSGVNILSLSAGGPKYILQIDQHVPNFSRIEYVHIYWTPASSTGGLQCVMNYDAGTGATGTATVGAVAQTATMSREKRTIHAMWDVNRSLYRTFLYITGGASVDGDVIWGFELDYSC